MARRRGIPWYRRSGFWAVIVLTTIALLGLSAIAYKVIRDAFPDMGVLRTHYPWVKYQGKGRPPKVTLKRVPPPTWVAIQDISPVVMGAVVVSEDWSFFSHDGYDAAEIKNSIQKDLMEGRFARGGSTITQQVVKNVFLERDKTLWRKFREFVLSIELDDKVSKRRILEAYLNVVELGEGIYGVGPAAQFYFKKRPSQLTPKEGAYLAMLLPSPKRYSQSYRDRRLTPYARKTVRNILRKMVKGHYLSQELYEAEVASPLSFEIAEAPSLALPETAAEDAAQDEAGEEAEREPEAESESQPERSAVSDDDALEALPSAQVIPAEADVTPDAPASEN